MKPRVALLRCPASTPGSYVENRPVAAKACAARSARYASTANPCVKKGVGIDAKPLGKKCASSATWIAKRKYAN